MIPPIRRRTVIDMNESVDGTRAIMDGLLAIRGLTGCDTVATYHGIGKSVAVKVLRSGRLPLSEVGDKTLSVEEALVQSAPVMLTCYGHKECSSLSDAGQKV